MTCLGKFTALCLSLRDIDDEGNSEGTAASRKGRSLYVLEVAGIASHLERMIGIATLWTYRGQRAWLRVAVSLLLFRCFAAVISLLFRCLRPLFFAVFKPIQQAISV